MAVSAASSQEGRATTPSRRSEAALEEARARARSAVAAAVSAVLGGSVADDAPLLQAGMDSLAAVELHNDLSRCGHGPQSQILGLNPSMGYCVGSCSSAMLAGVTI